MPQRWRLRPTWSRRCWVSPCFCESGPSHAKFAATVLDKSQRSETVDRRIVSGCEFILRHRIPIGAAFVMLAVASIWGWYTLKVDTDFVSYFPRNSTVRQRMQDVDRSLSGASAFFVVVETGRDDGATDPGVLKQIVALQTFLEQTPGIGKTTSIVDYVSQLNATLEGTGGGSRAVPDSSDLIAQDLLLMDRAQISRFIDLPATSANIVVRHSLTGSWELSQALHQLDAYVAEHVRGIEVRASGQSVLTNRAADYMAVNEVTSFVYTLAIIGLIHSALFMSVKAGLLSLVPNVIPVIYSFGLMGLFDIPLSTGTAMVATIAIGIAVDDTVHNMVTYSRQLNEHADERTAVIKTMLIQFRPIVFVSMALASGFAVLAFSRFVPTVYLGLLSAFVMIAAMISELVLSPILMASTRLVTVWDMLLDPDEPRSRTAGAALRRPVAVGSEKGGADRDAPVAGSRRVRDSARPTWTTSLHGRRRQAGGRRFRSRRPRTHPVYR